MSASVCLVWLTAALALSLAHAQAQTPNVSVVWKQLSFEETYELEVNASVEYILPFIPSVGQRAQPVRIWIKTDGGDTARPLLVTARRRIGARTWQVPYRSGEAVLYELERTLCPDDSVPAVPLRDDCDESSESAGQLSLHIGSSCVASTTVQLRASFVTDWQLTFESSMVIETVQGAPQVRYYMFPEQQHHVRLVVEADDDVCASVAVHNYTCPIAETVDDLARSSVRMTVLRSGGMQLTRSRYPRGFYVLTLVQDDDAVCLGDTDAVAERDDWLWEAAVMEQHSDVPGTDRSGANHHLPRRKTLTIRTKAALSRGQYAVGAAVQLALFALFYVSFGAAVVAARVPRLRRWVAPRAVLARKPDDGTRSEVESAMSVRAPRRRRDSTATFDSSDISDSDEEEDERATATTGATPPSATTPTTTAPSATTATVTAPSVTAPTVTALTVTDTAPTVTASVTALTTTAEANDTVFADAIVMNSINRGRDSPDNAGNINNGSLISDANVRTTVDVDTVVGNNDNDAQRVSDEQTAANSNGIFVINAATDERALGRQVSQARPFGLPARLQVAALSRVRGRVLAQRSARYVHSLATVGIFYALPVLQFVAAFQIILNVSGSLDVCYYNFLCAHPAGALADFNHVVSNAGYLLLGGLFMLQVRRRKMRRKRKPRDEEYGIPAHYGLLSALGAGMMMVALLSASYHVCPNGLNFQFDTAFMYVLSVLSMVKLYQARHADVTARAHATFGVLAVLIALVVWGVLGGGPLFWSVFTVLHVFTFLLLSLRIYYVGQFRLEKQSLQVAARSLAARPLRDLRPLYTPRLVMLLIANAVNWGFALYGLFTQSADVAGHLLAVLLCNTLLHMVFYLSMKLLHGERPRWYAWLLLAAAAAAWAPALYFFTAGSTDWSTTAALSRQLNHECRVLQFYDSHDLWHILSAIALYFSFNAMLTWDDGLAAVKRTEIAVF